MFRVSGYVLIALAVATLLLGCTRSADKIADQGTMMTDQAKTAVAPMQAAGALAQQVTPSPEPVAPTAHPGNVRVVPIESKYACTDRTQCTSTKYANAPASDKDCQCAAECTPFVVNTAERDRREAANKRLCNTEDWYGDQCPETPCGFMEFESFKCEAGKCVGMALGK